MSQPRVRALLFDVFGTLVDWHSGIVRQLEIFGTERGIECDWVAFTTAWRGEYLPSMNAVRTGARPWANLDVLQAESLDRLAQRFDLPPFSADDRARAVRFWHALEPWPEVPAGLERLRERYLLATLSNGSVELLVNLARFGNLRFDTIFSAETFRHYKPDKEMYLGGASLLGCSPEETMLVAAHETDLAAAAANGLRTAFVSRPNESGTMLATALALPHRFDVEIRGLDELADFLSENEGAAPPPTGGEGLSDT